MCPSKVNYQLILRLSYPAGNNPVDLDRTRGRRATGSRERTNSDGLRTTVLTSGTLTNVQGFLAERTGFRRWVCCFRGLANTSGEIER